MKRVLDNVLRNVPNQQNNQIASTALLKRVKRVKQMTQSSNLNSRADPDSAVEPRDGGPNCAVCGNKRYIVDAHGQLKPCEHCNVAQEWKVNSVRAFSSRAGNAARQTFLNYKIAFQGVENPILMECRDEAEAFANDPHERWLVIWGERGSGKSHLCAAVDNHLMHMNVPSLFITMPDLLASLREAIELQSNTETEGYTSRMSLFKTTPVLILDDLGAETSSPWSDGVLFELLDYRYRNRLATMICTNLNPDDFDYRIGSRMQDTELSKVIKNSAPDYRKRPVEEKR
jgi:DNA replication protein DnaC